MTPDTLAAEVRALLTAGRKIEAIKLYRERTGAGLAEAKQAVERIERGENPAAQRPSAPGGETDSPAGEIEQRLIDLLYAGKKIAAIKLYREQTGLGLKESKEAVEALAERRGISAARSGCLGVLMLLFSAALGLLVVSWTFR
jgi:ribosomal protein L7/L12